MKMIVFTNTEFANALTELMSLTLPVKTAYKLSKLHNEIIAESTNFDKFRKEIIQKYGKKSKSGELDVDADGNLIIPDENVEGLNNALKDLFDIDFEITKMSIDELGDISVSPKLLLLLSDVFTD